MAWPPSCVTQSWAKCNGVSKQVNTPPKGRKNVVVDDSLTGFQTEMTAERLLCDFAQCQRVIGSGFAALCGICRRWFHSECIELSRTTAHEVDLHKMELLCTACVVPAVLGKSYLRHHQLLSADSLFKAANDYSLYLEVCRLAYKNLAWETFVDFLRYFSRRCSQLDLHFLYSCSRAEKLAEFQRVSSLATLQRCEILQLAWAIDKEVFCHIYSATFAKHLRDFVDTACATPIMMSSERGVAVDQSPPCSDTDTEEEREDDFEVSQNPIFRSLSISSDGNSGGVSSVSGSLEPHRMENESFSGRKRPETCPAVNELRGSTVESPAVEGERQPAKRRRRRLRRLEDRHRSTQHLRRPVVVPKNV
ncbi:hypothetical protein DAPPUDRAFT_118752 [Daphnia pulex]|uniref:Zinc finger PHD-type domain-containing protein n=1 Tax=Daphnia pulex TaxID=6669 RepID=E9HWK7_DAPPU|nr:hypothetical protein DAPPUDRAFT_118752 [Daphnia pulex]|eukprot:EFX63872.1 hypothetical protein DAPPUDRAFT_118752 [Daphnia pulex]